MTLQEAISALKLINLKRVHPFYDWEEMREVRDTAINALEKQIPKKPNNMIQIGTSFDMRTEKHIHYFEGLCQACGTSNTNRRTGEEKTYCEMCGQALDWSDTECQIKK